MKTFDKEIAEYMHYKEKTDMEEFVTKMFTNYTRFFKLFEFLNQTEFWFAPASSKHHLNRIGGLAQHCKHVFEHLEKTHNPGNTEQNLMLAFCHDLCKLNIYKGKVSKSSEYYTKEEMEMRKLREEVFLQEMKSRKEEKIPKKEYWDTILPREGKTFKDLSTEFYGKGYNLRSTYDLYKPVYSVDDNYPIGHGEKSIVIALQNGINLSNDEIIAIRWHMGFDDKNWPKYRNNVHKKSYFLVRALQRADQDATHDEDEK